MAKVVFFNIPAYGHINPTLPVVQELVRRGATVIYYALEEFRQNIESAGASFRAYDELSKTVTFDFSAANRKSPSLADICRVMIEFCDKSLPFLLRATREDKPDYILHDFTCIWGKYVSEILSLPAITTIPQFPVNMKRRPAPYPGMLADSARMVATGIPVLIQFQKTARRISQTYSVTKPGLFDMLANHEDLNIVFTSRYFQPHAEDFDDRFVFVGPSIAERNETPDFSWDFGEGPLVYISLGTTIFSAQQEFYRQCFEAFGGQAQRVIVSVGTSTDIRSLGEIPQNFLVRNHVPQLEVLKRAAAFVTHGGMNSVSEGLWYGVPLVVIPQGSDQFFVAQRVAELKAGIVLDRRRITPEVLRQAVEQAISDASIRANAKVIGESFREAGGFVRAAHEITRFAVCPRVSDSA